MACRSGPTLMGRNWLQVLSLDWQENFHLHNSSNSTHSLHSVLEKHPDVFREALGTLKGFEAKIFVDTSALHKYCKSRSVPYFLREKLEEELDCLVSEGTLEPVQTSDCASSIVTVLKPDKVSVRVCGDFKQTVNPVSTLDKIIPNS